MTERMFVLALIQMRVVGGEKARNLANAQRLIAEAVQRGADVVLLPECLDLGWTHPSSSTEAEPIPNGEPCQRLMDAAARNGVTVCAGLTEAADDQVFNSAVFIDPKGMVRHVHRKLNELEIGHPYYAQGDRLGVVQTELATFGVMVCADAFARGEVLSRSLGYMSADVILSPSAWAVPADHSNEEQPYGDTWREVYTPVATDFSLWIAAASNVGEIDAGPWAGRKCIGCSLVVGHDGREVVQGPYGADAETILIAEVKPVPRPARGTGWASRWKQAAESEEGEGVR